MELGSNDFSGLAATDVEAALHPLGWSELCARLVAAQDLRRSMSLGSSAGLIGGPIGHRAAQRLGATPSDTSTSGAWSDTAPGSSPGSFHTGTARMLEHFETGKHGVNSTYSTNGKDSRVIPDDTRQTSLSADAERQADENRHD